MSKDYKQELKDMERLMMYGLSESKTQAAENGILEYSQTGAVFVFGICPVFL